MDKKSTFIIVGIIVLAVIVFVIIALQKSTMNTNLSSGDTSSTTAWENAPAEPPPLNVSEKVVINAKHAYRNGTHTIAGELLLPTPCHSLDAKAVVTTDKKSVVVQLVSSVKTGEVCAQVITSARFKVTAKADKGAKITAMLDGKEVSLNLIEAGPNEDLDNFEIYTKG